MLKEELTIEEKLKYKFWFGVSFVGAVCVFLFLLAVMFRLMETQTGEGVKGVALVWLAGRGAILVLIIAKLIRYSYSAIAEEIKKTDMGTED